MAHAKQDCHRRANTSQAKSGAKVAAGALASKWKRGCAGHHRTQGKAADSSNYQKWPRVALDLTIKPDSKQKYRNAH